MIPIGIPKSPTIRAQVWANYTACFTRNHFAKNSSISREDSRFFACFFYHFAGKNSFAFGNFARCRDGDDGGVRGNDLARIRVICLDATNCLVPLSQCRPG